MSLSFCILSILENLGKGEGDQSRRTARRLQKKPKKEKDKTISLCVDSCCNTAGSCDGITSVENLPLDCTLKSCKKVADTTSTAASSAAYIFD